ncbi:uncharacterized protein LOC134256040, partial [Saccostrea cucullata]|uniref:uncharacterized protein LOC134256040 n=1 Tax=Saccostrea cuccullata TaxID=36930 RepID=UPI002ED4826A
MATNRRELSLAEKNAIAELHRAGIKGLEIAKQTGHPLPTVYGVLRRLKDRGSIENQDRRGRPSLLSERDSRKHGTTIQRKIYEEGFHKCVVKKAIRIRAENVKKRLVWCKLNKGKTVNEHWKKVIFSDECKVELDMDKRVLVWRRPGEEWTPPCLNPSRGTRTSLMIWGCITYE